MTIFDMLGQSGVLTVLGMGIVFSFLVILVISVSIMGKIFHALRLDKDVTEQGGGSSSSGASVKQTAVTAAITAAVYEYRKKNS